MKNRILGSVVFAFASLVFVLPVSAQKETPPEGGSPKAFVFPKQDTYALPNGLKVTMVQYGSIPESSVSGNDLFGYKGRCSRQEGDLRNDGLDVERGHQNTYR
jgi:hypothetical protein